MYIKLDKFEKWLECANSFSGISPGGMAKDFKVTRQTVNNWINDDIIDAYSYEGREGRYVIIDISQYDLVEEYRKS